VTFKQKNMKLLAPSTIADSLRGIYLAVTGGKNIVAEKGKDIFSYRRRSLKYGTVADRRSRSGMYDANQTSDVIIRAATCNKL
jgi:hypothetical protein